VTAIDIDEISVDTTRRLLEKLVPGKAWKAEVRLVFDPASSDMLFMWFIRGASFITPATCGEQSR
jgi:hypothetical protein